MAWWRMGEDGGGWRRMALKGRRLGDKRPEIRVGEGLSYGEVENRVENYLEAPILRGRMAGATAVCREKSQLGGEFSFGVCGDHYH